MRDTPSGAESESGAARPAEEAVPPATAADSSLEVEAPAPVPVVPAIAIFLASIQIIVAGMIAMDLPYSSPGFARAFIPVEAALAITMLVGTIFFFRPAVIGLRAPRFDDWKALAPLAIMVLIGFGIWLARWADVPAGVERDVALTTGSFVATLLIGFTEEWMYRGLVLVLLTHWLGMKRGAVISLVVFGAVHGLNVAAGAPVVASLTQIPMAALSGTVFLLAAMGSRSLVVPMLGHALWDFFLVDGAQATALGSDTLAVGIVIPMPILFGVTSMFLLRGRLRSKPYAD